MENLNKQVLDAFGKIIYAVAKSDGEVQDAEMQVILDVIDNNTWAREVELSFSIEKELDQDAGEVFDQAIETFKFNEIGNHASNFLELLEKIAEAHNGIVSEEEEMIEKFKIKLQENNLL